MMRVIWRARVISIMSAFLLLQASTALAGTPEESHAAAILFGEFETVFRSKADLLLTVSSSSGPSAYEGLSKTGTGTLSEPFGFLLEGLDLIGKRASADIIGSSDAVLVGVRDFRPPHGLGVVHLQFCYVFVLKKESSLDVRNDFHQKPSSSTAGSPVWKWVAPVQEGQLQPTTFHVVQLGHSYVLISNDIGELQTIAAKLTSSDDSAQALNGIRDWKVLSSHEYWGYRRNLRGGALPQDATQVSETLPGAETLIFWVAPKEKTGRLQVIDPSLNEGAAAKVNERLAQDPSVAFPGFKSVGTGRWETTIPLSAEGGRTSARMFYVMSWFGFVVYI
ncbi:hypothetical protein [Candidatus Binatus sp.]|uniref:hypothetical protein n=1 Tax=Candidatus Binatus sp. TaxID=2811406 RepID=UPI003C746F4F